MDLETLLKLAGVQQGQSGCGCRDTPCSCSDTSEPTGMSKFIAMVSPELLGREQPAMEADDEWGNAPDGGAGPAEYEDGISNLGSTSDTSLRRYLKARGANVAVDEQVYPDLTVESIAESYAAYTAEKAKNPYAIGMAAAMKTTGDKPPLKKSTITKAHKIAKGIDEASDEAMSGTYAVVEYDYSEDFAYIELYKDGQKIEDWNGYFGISDHPGNPLADKFIELAKKNNLNPEGMSIVDSKGEKGTFGNNTFNWDQFAKEPNLDEAVTDEHRERALATINARITKPGQPPKHPSYDDAPADIKTAVDNLAKMYKESYEDLDEAAKPDFLDMDKDGDKKEPMKKAAKDKEKVSESISYLKKLAGI